MAELPDTETIQAAFKAVQDGDETVLLQLIAGLPDEAIGVLSEAADQLNSPSMAAFLRRAVATRSES